MEKLSVYVVSYIQSFGGYQELARLANVSSSFEGMSTQFEALWKKRFQEDWGSEFGHPLITEEKSFKKRYQKRHQAEVNWTTSKCQYITHDYLASITDHIQPVPNKSHLIVIQPKKTIFLVDTYKQTVCARLEFQKSFRDPVPFTSSDFLFVRSRMESILHVYTLMELKHVESLHLPDVRYPVFSLNANDRFLIVVAQRLVSVFELETFKMLYSFIKHKEYYHFEKIDWESLTGLLVWRGVILEICLKTGNHIRQIDDPKGAACAYLPNANQLVTGDYSGHNRIFDLLTFKELPSRPVYGFGIFRSFEKQTENKGKRIQRDISVYGGNGLTIEYLTDAITNERFPNFPPNVCGQVIGSTPFSLFVLVKHKRQRKQLIEYRFLEASLETRKSKKTFKRWRKDEL
jgi:hypothetical protein